MKNPSMKKNPSSCSMDKTGEVERDDLFYSESIVFKVENTLFSVPKKGLLQHGTFFETLLHERSNDSKLEMVQDSASDDATLFKEKLGSSDECPIVLEGVTKQEFRDFLRVVFPFREVSPPDADEQWLNVLRLSHMWSFPKVKAKAIDNLGHIFVNDPLKTIVLCKKYDIQNWLTRSYEEIITRNTAIDRDAMLKAGMDGQTVNLLSTLRDEWLTHCIWGSKRKFLDECKLCSVTHSLYCFRDTAVDQDEESEEDPFKAGVSEFVEKYLAKHRHELETKEVVALVSTAQSEEMQESDRVELSEAGDPEQDDTEMRDITIAVDDDRNTGREDDASNASRAMSISESEESEASVEEEGAYLVVGSHGSEPDSEEDTHDEEDRKFQDKTRTKTAALEELYNEFKGLLKTPPKKKSTEIDMSDVFECIRRFIKTYSSISGALERVAEILFEKALVDPSCSDIYADLCDDVAIDSDKMIIADPYNGQSTVAGGKFFSRQLYRLWYRAFSDRVVDMEGPIKNSNSYRNSNLRSPLLLLRAKQRRLALIKFMGELFVFDQIYGRSMGRYVERMIDNAVDNRDEMDIKSICYLLPLIGARFDCGSAMRYTGVYFDSIKGLTRDKGIPKRLRDMLEDVLDLRDRDWGNPPPTIRKWLPLK